MSRLFFRHFFFLSLLIFVYQLSFAQAELDKNKQYHVACIGFYNVENLYDTINQPNNDEEYLPESGNKWNTAKYLKKLENLSKVISEMAIDATPDGVAVLGLAEVENRGVLEDLVKTEKLKKRNYQIVHYDGPDKRGVDVALLYNPNYFTVDNSVSYTLKIPGKDNFYTRDQLLVSGKLDGEKVHIIVGHWPSRRGGEKRSRPLRNAAAQLSRHIADSIFAIEPNAKIMIMGDLNDDPTNESVKKHIKTVSKTHEIREDLFFNPMEDLYNKGIGTLAWKDSWSLFDQIILSYSLTKCHYETFCYYGAKVFNKTYVRQEDGNFKGYPFRTFAGGAYTGGYSDHFAVYIILLREKKE
jgi:hypothetical protein